MEKDMKYRYVILAAMMIFAGIAGACTTGEPAAGELSPKQALEPTQKAYAQFIDVRSEQEFAAERALRTRNIPLDQIPGSLDLINKDEPVYLICKTGRRSGEAAEILRKNGFEKVYSIAGGTDAWKAAGLPMAEISEK